MPKVSRWQQISSKPMPHGIIALFIVGAMLVSWTLRALHDDDTTASVLLIAVGIASVPLLLELMQNVIKASFSVDVLATLSIGTAIIFREYWVAAIVILMLSGGKTLGKYATRRASSILGALACRMPQIAHRLRRRRHAIRR